MFVEGFNVQDIIGFEMTEIEQDWLYYCCVGDKVCGFTSLSYQT
jgi:hypothetical protein